MKLFYKKKSVFKLFGIKIFDFCSDYYERSVDNEENDVEMDWHENLIHKDLK